MELFSEVYNRYYRAVEAVLCRAQERPLGVKDLQALLAEGAFSESAMSILPKLQSGAWPLLRQTEQGYAANCVPLKDNPLTTLQQAWMRAVADDPRIRLFLDEEDVEGLHAVLAQAKPLYSREDFYLFDKAADCDDFENREYQRIFKLFLSAIRGGTALHIQYKDGRGHYLKDIFRPCKLEYSQKDDKFRAYCYRKGNRERALTVLNLGRIISAAHTEETFPVTGKPSPTMESPGKPAAAQYRQVSIEISKERNALERSMSNFAHFEKRTEYDEATEKYICTIRYNVMDETEVVIRVLSFGPTVRVLGPAGFLEEIKSRVRKQTHLSHVP